uniref:Homing endonuclease LAGLIDADG domain-containing protein n=1 Tax=Capillidium heterosporum TaxID=1167838 RepID=A0A3T0QAI6_9FUNG|nr:hypothetical protein [Capillidium heterosporum]AZZ06699.1 hypothetical protein [Capillidium heterosporum]
MVQNLEGVLKVISLINGKMRTPKINALHKMIDWLNKYKLKDPIKKLPLDDSLIEDNAWLSGLIDSDGYFAIKGFTSKSHIALQFYLAQRKYDKSGESFEPILQKIAEFLKTSLKLRSIRGYLQLNITTSNKKSNQILIDYLTKYPLFTSKYLNYIDWKYAYELYSQKKHPIIYKEISGIKINMNNNRKKLNRDHLKNF